MNKSIFAVFFLVLFARNYTGVIMSCPPFNVKSGTLSSGGTSPEILQKCVGDIFERPHFLLPRPRSLHDNLIANEGE